MKIKVARKPANTYQHGNLREALVQAGLKLLSEGGVEGLSLRAAAQLAGVSHAAPYRHFKDKDALVAAIAEQGFRLLTASMRAELAVLDAGQAADPHQRLAAVGKGYVQFALQHPAYLRVIFGGVLAKDRTTPELKLAGNEAYETLRGLVADGVARGRAGRGRRRHAVAGLLVDGARAVASADQRRHRVAARDGRPGGDRDPSAHPQPGRAPAVNPSHKSVF